MSKFTIPNEVREVSETLSNAGYENYLVGGCVRDLVLGHKPKDWDITTNATPEQILELFPKTFYENIYGTVGVVNERTEDPTVKTVEVTPYRTEGEYSDSRHPDKVEWAKTLQEDLSRRDFTINAIALDLRTATNNTQLIDPFGGVGDIDKKTIRAVGNAEERFNEDALRILRGLRLASQLDFTIEYETLSAMEKCGDRLAHISKERIRDEFEKIVMSDSPGVALELCARLGVLKYISPELEKGIGVEQNQAHAYTVWEHLVRSLNHSAQKGFPLHIRLSAFLHDIAKPHTRRKVGNQWTFYGHEVVGAKLAKNLLSDLKFPKELVDKVYRLIRWHMFFSDTEEITLSAVRRMVRNVSPELIWDLMDVRACDRIGTGRPKEAPYRLRKYHSMIEEVLRDPISVKQLKVDGADIMRITGTEGGPHIGFILEILLAQVLENPKLNDKEVLESKVSELYTLTPSELMKQGKEARAKNASEDEKEVEKIREEYKVK